MNYYPCIKQNGIDSSRFPYNGTMPDEDDGASMKSA